MITDLECIFILFGSKFDEEKRKFKYKRKVKIPSSSGGGFYVLVTPG